MVIDLTSLVNGSVFEVSIDGEVVIPVDYLNGTSIRRLFNTSFHGKLLRLSDSDYQLCGNLEGVMVLPDDITLEDVDYSYDIRLEEDFSEFDKDSDLQIIQNRLDITDFLWQNILVEVPLKVKNDKNEHLTLEGDGWRFITEDDLKKSNDSPFDELSKMFDSGKE